MIHEVFAYLRVESCAAAIRFYEEAFGAKEKFRLVEPGGLEDLDLADDETTVPLYSAPGRRFLAARIIRIISPGQVAVINPVCKPWRKTPSEQAFALIGFPPLGSKGQRLRCSRKRTSRRPST